MSERIIIRHAQGFDVIEGHRLNREPLSRAEADRLAREAAAKAPELPPRVNPAAQSVPLSREPPELVIGNSNAKN